MDAVAQDGHFMQATQSVLAELDEAIRTGSSDRRIETLRRVTDLFLSNATQCAPEQVELFDDVLVHLIGHIENKALAELGQRLAPVPHAPMEVIRRLANHDEIAIAGPVLTGSSRLTAAELVTIARNKSQDHLLAISGRSQIDEDVTDVLVERGNSEVARKVAVNAGARFSERGFANLVERAENDDDLAQFVGQRADIPPQMFQTLLQKATEAVRERLLASLDPAAAAGAMNALNRISRDAMRAHAQPRDYSSAQHLIKLLEKDRKLNEAAIVDFAHAGRFEETVAALAAKSSAAIEIIERMMQSNRADGLMIPCKAAGLSWPTVRTLMQMNPAHRALSEESMDGARRDFLRLSAAAAQRILRFWQVRTSVNGKAADTGTPSRH